MLSRIAWWVTVAVRCIATVLLVKGHLDGTISFSVWCYCLRCHHDCTGLNGAVNPHASGPAHAGSFAFLFLPHHQTRPPQPTPKTRLNRAPHGRDVPKSVWSPASNLCALPFPYPCRYPSRLEAFGASRASRLASPLSPHHQTRPSHRTRPSSASSRLLPESVSRTAFNRRARTIQHLPPPVQNSSSLRAH